MERTRKVIWRLALRSPPAAVWQLLATDEGRARFWAERTQTRAGQVIFSFPDGSSQAAAVLEAREPAFFELEYFGARTTFELSPDGSGTLLTMTARNVPREDYHEVHAGWVSVLLALKAAVDHGVDLRNHDPQRSWAQGFCDN